MNKIYLIFLGVVIVISSYSQSEYPDLSEKEPFHKNNRGQKNKLFTTGAFHLNHKQPILKEAYEEQLRLDSLVGYIWDDNIWIIDYKEEYIYNEIELINEHRRFVWEESSGNWVLYDKEVYEYSEMGNLVLSVYHEQDETGIQWYTSWKRDYFYDENNLITEYVESLKNSPDDDWNLSWKVTFAYNAFSRPSSTLEYIYSEEWAPSWKSEYTYDEQGNLIKYEEFSDDGSGGWINETQSTYLFDENNSLIEFVESEWNETEGDWNNSDRDTFTYLDNNNVEIYYDYDWSEPENDWVLFWKEELSYDNSHAYEQLTLPWFFHDDMPNFMNHQLTEFRNYNYVNSVWIPASMGKYYFSAAPSTYLPEIGKPGVSFYPNPVSNMITFKFNGWNTANLQIYDLTGKAVHSQLVENNRPVNVGGFTKGLYLFRLTGEDRELIFSDKIVIK